MLTPDHGLIIEALQNSDIVEVSPDCRLIRANGCFNQWILPSQHQNVPHAHPTTVEAAVNTVEVGEDHPASPRAEGEDDIFLLDEV